jgi:hypothetical protein
MIRVTFAIVAMGFVLYCACTDHKRHHYLTIYNVDTRITEGKGGE